MSFITDLFRRLAVLGATLFGILLFLLITHLARNPSVIDGVLSGIGDMLNDVFSVAKGV